MCVCVAPVTNPPTIPKYSPRNAENKWWAYICNIHPIPSQYDSVALLISAGFESFLTEATGGPIVYSSACWC